MVVFVKSLQNHKETPKRWTQNNIDCVWRKLKRVETFKGKQNKSTALTSLICSDWQEQNRNSSCGVTVANKRYYCCLTDLLPSKIFSIINSKNADKNLKEEVDLFSSRRIHKGEPQLCVQGHPARFSWCPFKVLTDLLGLCLSLYSGAKQSKLEMRKKPSGLSPAA